MRFRRATADDAPALAALIRSFLPLLTVDPGGAGAEAFLDSVSADAERGYIGSGRYRYLVAEADGAPAGFVAMRDTSHLFHLFVAAPFQCQGLARELWRRARESALANGHRGDFTVNASLNAVPVYRRFGFVEDAPQVQAHGIAFVPMRLRADAG